LGLVELPISADEQNSYADEFSDAFQRNHLKQGANFVNFSLPRTIIRQRETEDHEWVSYTAIYKSEEFRGADQQARQHFDTNGPVGAWMGPWAQEGAP
jgi:hypothetical protein